MLLIYSIICFIEASIILNMKVVPNDNFKFGGERVNSTDDMVMVDHESQYYTVLHVIKLT